MIKPKKIFQEFFNGEIFLYVMEYDYEMKMYEISDEQKKGGFLFAGIDLTW